MTDPYKFSIEEVYRARFLLDHPDTPTNYDKVYDFHEAMEMTINQWPPTQEELDLRSRLIGEEFEELDQELYSKYLDKQKIAKELSDLLYVIYGTAVSFGIPIDDVFSEVHESNMSKLVDGKPLKRADGKVLKGPNYQPPNLEHIFK